ncbi:MAG: phosphoglycerate kinase [Helicobacteraceae bacterium]|jgi:phosphoglycerate kinase|nr:phosphoglycerate kinase [Helicobacteraceae bacterium]
MELKQIKDIDIADKKVFIRCDFNVPQDEFGNITDDRRIRSALATINYCVDHNCAVILASHNGRPKGEFDAKYSLAPIAKRLQTLLKRDVILAADVVGEDAAKKVAALEGGGVLLLENLRFEKGETKNDETFAKRLADMAEIYINDAFGVSHRAHASVEAITKFFPNDKKVAGFLLSKEINFFDRVLRHPTRPFIAVIGGSKVSGKLQALENLLHKVDKLIIGGGMAFTFLKALGEDVGDSLVEDDLIPDALRILEEAKRHNVKLYLPVDVVCAQSVDAGAVIIYTTTKEIPAGWKGLDIGPATTRLFREALEGAQTILWNGPMGVYEIEKFAKGSFKISHRIAESHATKIVGGGDTADVVQRADDADEMTFISTGGGASLELLEGKILPGVQALMSEEGQ